MAWNTLAADPRIRIPLTAILDAALAGGCATILWNSGGTTVINGSWILQVACFVLAAALLTLRHALFIAQRTASRGHVPLRTEQIIAGIDVLGLACLTGIWVFTQQYYLGWIATFSAVTLTIASVWQLLSALVTQPHATPGRTRQRDRLNDLIAAITTLRALTCAISIGALVVLTDIHGWNPTLLSGLIVFMCGAVLFAVVVRAWIAALTASPGLESSMRRTPSGS